MGCHGNHAFRHSYNKFFSGDTFLGHDWGSNEQFDTHENLSWGSKVGQIRSYGTSNMILIACFRQIFFIFRIFFHSLKILFPLGFFLRTFFSIKQDTFLILKLLITFLKELVVGQGSFSAHCTGLFHLWVPDSLTCLLFMAIRSN